MMTPQIENQLQPNTETIEIPSKTYKLTEDSIKGFVDNKEAVQQAVYHILSVERYSNPIYDDNYGVELEQYIGQDFEYIQSTIEDTLREALTQDLRILNVIVTNIEKIKNDSINVKFDIISTFGNIQAEVNLNV